MVLRIPVMPSSSTAEEPVSSTSNPATTSPEMGLGGPGGLADIDPKTGHYKPYYKDGKKITELARFNPVQVFLLGFLPPLVGSISAIAIALIFHNDEISNYNWQCGRARLPSLSRIINLPVERTFWQLCLLFHVPIRIVELLVGVSRYDRLRNIHYKPVWFYNLARRVYFYVGLAELFFLAALSIVGERENIRYHVIFFYVFGFCGIGFFISNTVCHRQSLYYLNPYGRLAFRLKVLFAVLYMLCVPVLIGAFLLYWKKSYDVFAVCEYLMVLLNICFHGCAFFDIRYKVIFSVRLVEDVKKVESTSNADKTVDTTTTSDGTAIRSRSSG